MATPARQPKTRSWSVAVVALVGAAALAGCASGSHGTSVGASTTTAGSGSSGAAASTGASAGGSGGSSGTNGGSSTGAIVDGGCGRPGNVDGGGACVLDRDCLCPFSCVASLCTIVCARDSDCPPASVCLDGGACEFYCRSAKDCPPANVCLDGGVCEFHCRSDADCAAGDVCLDGGMCAQTCDQPGDCPYADECMDAGLADAGICEPIPNGCAPAGGADQFQGCYQNSGCDCPFDCFADIRRGYVCEKPCSTAADCPESDEICEGDAGACQRTSDCYGEDAGIPILGGCGATIQCACPLNCFDNLCEPACMVPGDCVPVGDAGQFCEGDAGFCLPIPVCNPMGGSPEFGGCVQTTGCQCPLECVVDPRRGPVCELPCADATDCASDEICEGDAGACQRTSSCFGGDAGVPEWNGCTATIQCACPLTCIVDPRFSAVSGPLLCEQCDAGNSCDPPAGTCVDGGSLLAEAQYGKDSSLWTGCSDSSACVCPNQCLPVAGGASWACQLPPPACASNADCPDPTTTCISGGCIPNICPSGAVVTQPCDVAFGQDNPPLTGDGECLPSFLGGATLLCVQGGTATGSCRLPPYRNDSTTLCPSGSICVPADGGNICAPLCQIGTLPDCDGGGGNCTALNPAYLDSCPGCTPPLYALQACLPGQSSCTDDMPTYEPVDGPFDSSAVGLPFAPCAIDDCLCPSTCVYDYFLWQLSSSPDAGTFCESSCNTSADCPWPQTNCNGGVCALNRAACNVAVPKNGLDSNLGAACSDGTSAGTCVYFSPFVLQPEVGSIDVSSTVALCRINGSATSTCDPNAQRGSQALCGAGTDCLPLPDGGYGCQAVCDPIGDAGSCEAGETCVPATRYANGINEGVCLDLADAGCAVGLAPNEFAPCRSEADCACGYRCAADPDLPVAVAWTSATTFCERECSATTDCPLDTYCFGEAGERTCRLNLCGDSSPVSPICNGDNTSDATCIAQGTNVVSQPFLPSTPPAALAALGQCGSEPALSCIPGLCMEGGTATGVCDPSADRSDPDEVCVPGAVCDTSGPTPMCTWLCTVPNSAGSCPDGEVCLPLPGSATAPGAGNLQGDCQPAAGVDAGT